MTYSFSNVTICQPDSLYKWAKIWGSVQKKYYKEKIFLRREKQILDFIFLNQFKNVYVDKDTDVFAELHSVLDPADADLILITDQKFSRMPCHGIVGRINLLLEQCPNLLICLNRHYINLDNSFIDPDLDDNLNLAITQWLKKNIVDASVVDLSLDYLDRGDWFTWVIPDRIYFITKK
jgi:hypothetical protein